MIEFMCNYIKSELMALLFMGSAILQAQTLNDPFPDVNYNKFPDNMELTGQVRLGGHVLGEDAIVAVFHNNEIRGKSRPFSQHIYVNILSFVIGGEKQGEALHFKVFTGGRIIEVDQGVTFTTNGALGDFDDFYYIDLPAPVVTNPSKEGWGTVCLPFNAKIPSGVTAYTATGVKDKRLMVAKVEGSILPANTPVLLESNPANGSFEWLSCVDKSDVTIKDNIFLGTTQPTKVAANSVFTLGHSNETGEIGFWRFTGTEIPANRAYITNLPTEVKGLRIEPDDSTDGLEAPFISSQKGKIQTDWYDLNGRKFKGKPTQPGVYINNGNKMIICS